MSDEHIEARNGFVEICIGGGYEREPENYTPDEVMQFAARLVAAARHCEAQKAAIQAACAAGHLWSDGTHGYSPLGMTEEHKVTCYWCEREGCDGRKVEEGWADAQPPPYHEATAEAVAHKWPTFCIDAFRWPIGPSDAQPHL